MSFALFSRDTDHRSTCMISVLLRGLSQGASLSVCIICKRMYPCKQYINYEVQVHYIRLSVTPEGKVLVCHEEDSCNLNL